MMTCIAIDSSGRVFTATDSGRVFITSGDGSTWTSSVLTTTSNTHGIQAMLITPAGHVYTAGGQGIWYSEDHGQTWTESNTGLLPPYSAMIALSRDGYLYSGFTNGIFRTTAPIQ
jgi:ligand-binding sensor domain-containing protein